MRFLWLDTYYQAALDHFYQTIPGLAQLPYEQQRRALLDQCFGTSDFWDVALRAAGHESETVIANAEPLQKAWCRERSISEDSWSDIWRDQLAVYDPDFACSQNVGAIRPAHDRTIAFCSYAVDLTALRGWDIVFTSFSWAVKSWREQGINAHYLPLAFGRPVLDRIARPTFRCPVLEPTSYNDPVRFGQVIRSRLFPISFAGGLGHRHIWDIGQDVIARLARDFPEFVWRGYGPASHCMPLKERYLGQAWGHDYWKFLMSSQILINRHGEIARCTNNLRTFEGPGTGCCLVTENSHNLRDFFVPGDECVAYINADGLVSQLRLLLDDPARTRAIGAAGHTRVLKDHCYENRVPQLLDVLSQL